MVSGGRRIVISLHSDLPRQNRIAANVLTTGRRRVAISFRYGTGHVPSTSPTPAPTPTPPTAIKR